MNSRVHDGGKRLQFGSSSPIPPFRHPYEKYTSRISNDSFYRSRDQGRGSDAPDATGKRSSKTGRDGRESGRKGLEERNTLICQTFLTENPFFGAYYPAIRPRSAEGISNRGSERSRSLSTDFDDSKTYKIIYTGDSVCNENEDSLTGNKFKKSDDIRHFHEHHHFFHDKNDDASTSTYYDKYQYAKAKEQTKSSVADSSKSFLKQPIQESCMIYQVQEDRTPRSEPEKEKSRDGARHLSRSSSKSGKKSSDNETYTVLCEHCQKLLRDYPNARIVGHENILKKLSSESYDRRTYVAHGCSYDPVQKTSWKPANIFVAEPQYQVHRLNVMQESSRQRRGDRSSSGSAEKADKPRRSGRRLNQSKSGERSRDNFIPKVSSRKPSMNDSDSRSIIFKCDHCKSIIEKYSEHRKIRENTSSSSSSDSRGGEFNEKTDEVKNLPKGNLLGKSPVKDSTATKRSGAVGERRIYKGLKGSRGLDKKMSSIQRVSKKGSSQKLSKATSERRKSPVQRTSRPSRVMDGRSSSYRESKELNVAEKRRSSSYNALRDTGSADERRNSGYKERRASSEMSKRNNSSGKVSSSWKRTNSGFKDSSESKQMSSSYKECSVGKRASSSKRTSREPARVDKKSAPPDKKACSAYEESGNACAADTRREPKESGVKRSAAKESGQKKVEKEKARGIQTEDRSMQTTSRKLASVQESAEPKRSSTASKTIVRNGNAEESKRSGTAPGGLVSSGSASHTKNSTVRGSATLSRRTVSSKDTPVIQVESTPEAKRSSKISGIQTEITDLKSQLDRLEALHNLKADTPESSSNAAHEAIDCPKHPIVVCTSTTYIMTKCANECGDRKTVPTPKESDKIPPKEESPTESGPAEDASASKCKRFCCSEANQSHKVGAGSAEKTSKGRCCLARDSPPYRAESARPNCQFVGARITRAINKVCHCPNRDFLSKYCDTPGRTRSCDRGDTCRRLFGNGKNQRRAWLRGGLLTNYCKAREDGKDGCCRSRKCCEKGTPDLRESAHRSYSDTACENERLISYQSYSTVLRHYDLDVKVHDHDFGNGISRSSPKNEVEIDDTSRPGYFLRTSISDVCEYRNGSLIRLIGKSGWVVYTKKLFLEDKQKNGSELSNRCEFVIFPTGTSTSYSKSNTSLKKGEQKSDGSRESRNLIFLNDRQVLSDSSIYLPLALRRKNFRTKTGNSRSSVYLNSNFRFQNRGISNFRDEVATTNFPNELHLLDCKSAADRVTVCKDDSGNGQRCTCRRRRRKDLEERGSKQKKEKIPVLFEEMKTPREDKEGRRTSDVSVKFVYAEKSGDSKTANAVTWSTDCSGSKSKKPCVFGVSRSRKNRRNREHFSMNDKQRKYRWHRSTSRKNKENSYGTYNKPQGDSPQNRCACCNCSPTHTCSAPCEKEEGELTGIRKLLKDIGISGLTLGFSRKTPYCRSGFVKPQNVEEVRHESRSAIYYDNFQKKEKEEVEGTGEVREEITKEEVGSSVTDLKKVSPAEDRCCDCVKQLEQLLTQAEVFKQPAPGTITAKHGSWEEMWNAESRKPSLVSTKKEPSLNPDVLDDISLQRRRITECEILLRQFEMQLENVKRQNEAYVCKCEESPRQEEPRKEEEPDPAPQNALAHPVPSELELEVLTKKCPTVKDDGCIRFEGRILTQLTPKRSTKSIGCGVVNEECKRHCSAVQTVPKTCIVKNATQMTSDVILMEKESQESEHLVKEIDFEAMEVDPNEERTTEDCTYACCSLPQKIEICSERKICACEKCCNIHFTDKHYIPTKCFKKCQERAPRKKEEPMHVLWPKKETFTNTSERSVIPPRRDECTSCKDLSKSGRHEKTPVTFKPRRKEAVPLSGRPTKRDEATSTLCRVRKDEATSTVGRLRKDEGTSVIGRKDEATSTTCRAKKDEATSTASRPKKDEATACKMKADNVSHKEVPRVKVEIVPVKSASKVKKEETTPVYRPKKDEFLETDRPRLRKESDSISEKETFVHQSDLDKSPSEGDNAGESSSKDLSQKSFAKSRAGEVVCECGKTSSMEQCEGDINCECASKGIHCSEKRKARRFCDCGSKLKLIEDRLRALEERKRLSELTMLSPKERKESAEESSAVPEKVSKMSADSSVISEKELQTSSEASSSSKTPQKESSEESSVSYEKEKELSEEESSASQAEKVSSPVEEEGAGNATTESSSLTEKTTSLENIESETDVEIKTKVITCHNMNFFDGGDPNAKTKCQCMEDSFCPFKYFHAPQDLAGAKNFFFVTNIDLLRQWSGMYGGAEYSYCKNFWDVNESTLKPVKLPRDWRNVKTAVASFFRSCKLRKKKFMFKRRKRSGGESSANSAASKSNITSRSADSFLDDCSRSSMPLRKRSFHVLAKGPRPTRPAKEKRKTSSDKRRRKKSRKKKIHS